jgi:hypothetical protein
MRQGIIVFLLATSCVTAKADWAVAPDLISSTLWKMVAEGRASVVSSVGFGNPEGVHEKQTVFILSSAKGTDKNIKWAVRPEGLSPVMCSEKWNGYQYLGSSCSIPGVLDPKDLTITK